MHRGLRPGSSVGWHPEEIGFRCQFSAITRWRPPPQGLLACAVVYRIDNMFLADAIVILSVSVSKKVVYTRE